MIEKGKEYCQLLENLDPNIERKFKVTKAIQDSIQCYKFEHEIKVKQTRAKQSSIKNFFTKTNK